MSAAAHADPCISFEEERYYFGKVYKNELREHLFEFENTGDDDLFIEGLTSSCKCILAEASSSFLRPGERGHISVQLSTEEEKGTIIKRVKVHTNDPKKPVVVLFLHGLAD